MDLLKPGQKLSIFFEKDNNIVEIECSIAKVYGDRMVIDLPNYFMRYIEYLEVGKKLTIKVFSKVGTIDFNTIIISAPLEDEFCVELDYNAMVLTEGSDVPVVSALENLVIKLKTGEEFTVKTFEISTQFMKIYCNSSLQEGDVLNCELILPKDYGRIKFTGKVTEIDPIYDNEVTVTYSQINAEARQNLLYYMYVYNNAD